jgi:predicted short-subunit dehydrogenase-like oxidoreductase (DUF2520 family)
MRRAPPPESGEKAFPTDSRESRYCFPAIQNFRVCAKFSDMKISIIGVGRMGGALALALARKGYSLENLIARRRETAQKVAELINPKPRILSAPESESLAGSEVIFICTQDAEIEKAAESLAAAAAAAKLSENTFIFHVSGSLSSSVLRVLREAGFRVGSMHPLVSASDPLLGAESLSAGVCFCVEGEPEAVALAQKIVLDLEGKSFTVPSELKPLYHAAAVTAAGHLTALVSVAVEMLAACGLSNAAAQEILLPLVKSAVFNLEAQTPAEALTGTFARADVETLRRHLEILPAQVAPELAAVYLQLGLRSLHLAESRESANRENLRQMRRLLRAAENKFRQTDS